MNDRKNPLVTVYVVNHDYGRFIEQAIQSVLDQTLQDFELFIIDDGSTDGSRDLIEQHAEHPKVTTIFQQNKGLIVTNNIALRAARGRYIMRLDADDYLDENALTVLAGVLERHPDVGMVFPDYVLIDEDGRVMEVVRRHDFENVSLLDQPAHGACTMIRRKCLLALEGYDESFSSQDGFDLWIRLIQYYHVKNVNLPLFYYRQHSASLTRKENHILDTRARILEKHALSKSQPLSAIAVIPVRGGGMDPASAGLRILGGRTVLDWTLQPALEARRLSDVVLTTPDPDLIAHVSSYYKNSVLTVRRHPELAQPNTYIEDTLFHALEEYTKEHSAPDVLVVLYIESPFRSAQNIDTAVEVMEVFDTDTVVGVRADTDIFYQHDGNGLQPLRKTRLLRLEREELFREVGRLCVVKREFLEKKRQLVGGKVGHIVLDQCAALRLNSEWDWEVAELLARKMAGTVRE